MKPRIQEPEDPELLGVLDDLDTKIATTHDWEAAFVLVFGQRALEEEYPCIDWNRPRREWTGDAAKFADAFAMVDEFVFSVMH
jgi:hypothetical protein